MPGGAQPYSLTFEHITTRHGLPGSRIYALHQDRQGFLWIGTESGLASYDGYTFVTYKPERTDASALPNIFVTALAEDSSGTLWIGFREGLFALAPGGDRLVHKPLGGAEASVRALLADPEGILWVGTDHGLVRLDQAAGTLRRYETDPHDAAGLGGPSPGGVNALLRTRDGSLWAGTDHGLNRLAPGADGFTRYEHRPAGSTRPSEGRVTALFEDREGALWVGTGHGLNRLDPATGRVTRYAHAPGDPTSLSRGAVETILEDRQGLLWVGTWGGADGGVLHAMDRTRARFTRYSHVPDDPNSLRRNYAVLSLYEDRSGVLWIGTGGGYLHKLDGTMRHFVRYRRGPEQAGSLGAHYVFAVHEDRQGAIWIGTGAGLDRFDTRTGGYAHYRHVPGDPRSLAHPHVRAVYEDRAGTVWVGTEGGLSRYDAASNRFTYVPLGEHRQPVWVVEVYEDRQGRLWIGTNSGTRTLDPRTGRFATLPTDGPPDQDRYVQAILQDGDGAVWVGMRVGLVRYDAAARVLPVPEALAPLRTCNVRAFHEDRRGRLWIGTMGEGLWRYDPATGAVAVYTQEEGLPSNAALDVLEDEEGHVWIRTLSGISRLDPAAGRITSYEAERALGVSLNEWGAMSRNAAGRFVFGGDDGLVLFDPAHIERNPFPPRVVLTQFSLFSRPVQPGERGPLRTPLWQADEVRLSYRQNDVSFDFVALHFSRPEKNQYAYMLEPYDTGWRAAGTQRRATYTNLSPGAYVFRVRAANADGVWNEAGAAVRLVIVPPFWMRPWFYALVAALLGLVIYGGYRLRVRHLQAHARELSRHVEARTRELVLEKRKTEAQARRLLELDAMKSHFFANLSHEFRTPLTLIMGPLEDLLAGRSGRLPPAVQEQHRLMLHSARRVLRMISELLDLAKLEAGKMTLEPTAGDFVAFLRNLTRAFAPLAERKHIMLQCRSEQDALPCAFDREKLEKVFSNLLSNALKFTPEGGKVWLTIHARGAAHAPQVEVVVKDTGPGIPAAGLSAIFDRFEQAGGPAARRHGGTGLGLALTKELVELHGGKIMVESELGFGSAFLIRLPLRAAEGPATPFEEPDVPLPAARPPADVSASSPASSPAPGAARPTVLVVEDNAEVRAYLRGLLEADYDVLEAADGEAGLAAVRRAQPALVLCDVMLPGLSGFDLCRLVKNDAALRLTPVVLLTALADEAERLRGLQLGADDYVAKPFNTDALKARLDNLLASRREMRTAFSREIVVQPHGVVAPSEDEAFLRGVMDVVDANLGDSGFTVALLADELGLSRRQLHRKVQALVGESPADLLRRLRLERGRQLLAVQNATISEVAYAVGYSSPSNFARAFRDLFGVSPTEFVEQAAAAPADRDA